MVEPPNVENYACTFPDVVYSVRGLMQQYHTLFRKLPLHVFGICENRCQLYHFVASNPSFGSVLDEGIFKSDPFIIIISNIYRLFPTRFSYD